jgi:hypothetical protein
MAAKLALAALISIGVAIVSIATVGVVAAESGAGTARDAALAAECACGSADPSSCEERSGHLAWNAASWLVGLALVVAVGRRGKTPPNEASS